MNGFLARLKIIDSPLVRDCSGRGLLIGVEIDIRRVSARTLCQRLADRGVLTKDTHDSVIRFAPHSPSAPNRSTREPQYSPRPSTR